MALFNIRFGHFLRFLFNTDLFEKLFGTLGSVSRQDIQTPKSL